MSGAPLTLLAAGVALLTALAALPSCVGAARVADSLELGFQKGSGSTSSSFSGVGDHGPSHSSQELPFAGTGEVDDDWHAWTFSVRPLAWLYDPNAEIAGNLRAYTEALRAAHEEPSGAGVQGERLLGAASADEAMRLAPEPVWRVETGAGGERLYFSGDALVAVLDPLEPHAAPAPVDPPSAPEKPAQGSGASAPAYTALAIAAALAGLETWRQYMARKAASAAAKKGTA